MVVIFEIKNRQEDYAKCYAFIQYISAEKTNLPYKDIIKFKLYNNQGELFEINNRNSIPIRIEKSLDKLIEYDLKSYETISFLRECYKVGDIVFYFHVRNTVEEDCVNFNYFELIADKVRNCFIGIVPVDGNDIFRISNYYSIFTELEIKKIEHEYILPYDNRFFIIKRENNANSNVWLQHFNRKGNFISKKFFPLFKINSFSYECLSLNVKTIFPKNNSLFKFEENNIYKNNNEMNVYKNSLILFCSKVYSSLEPKYREYLVEIKEIISEISILALAYLLSYLHFTDSCEISRSKINYLTVKSEDFAEGTLQLIENALIHANNGYFCFRIHNSKEKTNYFCNYYSTYINNIHDEYLEILISDYNDITDIPHQFYKNIKKNSIIDDSLKQAFYNIQLKDLFDYSNNYNNYWKKYYSYPNNISLHYGLLSFEQVVNNSNGCFSLISTSKNYVDYSCRYINTDKEDLTSNFVYNNYYIPGTQYRILLPIDYISPSLPTGLNTNLNLEDRKIKNVKTINISAYDVLKDIYSKYKSFNKTVYVDKVVTHIKNIISNFNNESNTKKELLVLCINANDVTTSTRAEIVAKSIIWLVNDEDFNINKIGIINASSNFFSIFIRTFGLLYYKKQHCKCMKNKEIFLCDCDCQSEIEFYGENIEDALAISRFLSDAKGEYSPILTMLKYVVYKCGFDKKTNSSFNAFPFDVLLSNGNSTMFEQKVKADLNRDVQSPPFGCKLNDVHMQVGSKIHINDSFFEATLLFEISNYVSRFSYLLADKINSNLGKAKKSDKFILVGYETYSEMLIVQLRNVLEKLYDFKNCAYVIYDDENTENHFRKWNNISYDAHFINIVPIGSTLTTHKKIESDINRCLDKIYKSDEKKKADIILNLCVVLIRNSDLSTDDIEDNQKWIDSSNVRKIEKTYWKSIDTDKKIVTMNKSYGLSSNDIVNYVCCVENKWSNQDECEDCYPEDDLTKEKPILKVNKASVVPMTMIGIKDKCFNRNYNIRKCQLYNDNTRFLRNSLQYGHYKRGDNHFEFYIKTDVLFEEIYSNIESRRALNSWCLKLKKDLNKRVTDEPKLLRFDFIVAPLHKTNAAFVEFINKSAFGLAKMILWIDIKKEYRDNIKTKYSNLTQLAENLIEEGKKAEINFHYIDDTITTGYSYNRVKSLINSLFSNIEENGYININLFSSVILLLNRCSEETKKNYISNIDCYYSFINLNISAMRNHDDACSQCKKRDDYINLKNIAAGNSLQYTFTDLADKFRTCSINENNKTIANKYEFYKLLYTHKINVETLSMGAYKNDKNLVLNYLYTLLDEIITENSSDEEKVSKISCVLEIVSSPFIEYRYSIQQASFKLLLEIADFILSDDKIRINKMFSRLIESTLKNDILMRFLIEYEAIDDIDKLKEFANLFRIVFEQLSRMGANYVLRSETIIKYFNYVNKVFSNLKNYNETENWSKFYIRIIKQSLYLINRGAEIIFLKRS